MNKFYWTIKFVFFILKVRGKVLENEIYHFNKFYFQRKTSINQSLVVEMCEDICDLLHDKIWPAKTTEQREKRKNKYLIRNVTNQRRRIVGSAFGSKKTTYFKIFKVSVPVAALSLFLPFLLLF
jgi:hypothetical protein